MATKLTLAQWAIVKKKAGAPLFNSPSRGNVHLKGENDMTVTLYKWLKDGVETYGHKLAVDGSRWVMKNSATAELEVMNKEAVIEVLPYTVSVQFAGAGKEYQYFATAGELAVGDIVMMIDSEGAWSMIVVKAVDTQSRMAIKTLAGYVLSGAKALTVVE